MFNVNHIRNDFPFTKSHPNLAFLDSAASAQKPQCVIDAISDFYANSYANIHRGLYDLSANATTAYESARATVAQFIGAPSAENIVFTRNATESINLVASSYGGTFLNKGDVVLISEMEHHANIVPWQMLRETRGIELHVVPCNPDGAFDLEIFERMLTEQVKLVAITQVSNVLGTVVPVREVVKLAHSKGAKVLIDGSQAVVHGGVNVTEMGADFYAFTGHKLYGPTGIGVLYGKSELLNKMPPYQGGGDMIEHVSFEATLFAKAPARFEAGTPNIAGAIGLAAAINYVEQVGLGGIANHENELLIRATEGLKAIDGVQIIGTAAGKAPVLSFTLEGAHHSDVAMILNQCNVAVRSGHHCAEPLMNKLNISGTVRASFALYNTANDVEKLINSVQKASKMLK